MYIYGFTSLSSTIHIAAAHPKTAGGVAILALAGLLTLHFHKSTTQQKPVERPVVQTSALIQR